MSNKVVVLDLGHGGRDPGALGKTTQEKNNNLTLGLKVGKILQNHNVTVHYTRTTDKDFCDGAFDLGLDLQNRIAIVKKYNPDIFTSFHNNAFNQQVKGLEVHCFKAGGGDQKLAQRVYNQLSNLPFIKRGVKISNFYVLRLFDKTKTDACLVEFGFIDSEEDKILANMDKASILIAKGLLEHLGITYVESFIPVVVPVKPNLMYRVILDGKQISAVSFESVATSIVKLSVDNGKALKGIVQRIDGLVVFEYIKPQKIKQGKIIFYIYPDDECSAKFLSKHTGIKFVSVNEMTTDIFENYEIIYQVGGQKVNSNVTNYLAGNDMWDTLILVLKEIGKL